MGAEFDSNFIEDPELKMTDAELDKLFAGIIEEAEYQHGHAGYSGTFAEKMGAEIHRDKVFADKELAEKFVMDVLDSDKWGPADIVPIAGQGWYIGGFCSS